VDVEYTGMLFLLDGSDLVLSFLLLDFLFTLPYTTPDLFLFLLDTKRGVAPSNSYVPFPIFPAIFSTASIYSFSSTSAIEFL
jgi:hypothetical protein